MDKALNAGAPSNREATLAKFFKDEVAPSGVGPRKTRWTTWCRLHHNWLGPDVPVLPLTTWSITVVAAQLKEGGYRSPGDYLSTAKNRHLREHERSTTLARQRSVSLRSCTRGLGPGRQCAELLLEDFTVGADMVDTQKGIPVGFKFAGVLAYFFVLREMEQSLMLYTSVSVDVVKEVVTLQLPASKTDWVALSCERSWGCVCTPGSVSADACPYHAARAQQSLLKEKLAVKWKILASPLCLPRRARS